MGNTKRNRSKKNSSLKKFEKHLDLGFLNPVKSIMKGGVTTSTILNNGSNSNNDFNFVDLKTYLHSEDKDDINEISNQLDNQEFIKERDMVVITIDVSELDKDKNSVLCLTDGSSKKYIYILLSNGDNIQSPAPVSELAVIPTPETAPVSETAVTTVNKNFVLPS